MTSALQQAVPQARWEVYRGDPRESKQHKPVLLGPFGLVNPAGVVYKQALGPVMHGQ
ncbi:hypothetical protein GCM10009528_23590 [Kineococcus aurantiacus]